MSIGVLFLGLYSLPANSIALVAGRTSLMWCASGSAVGVSVLTNVYLLPRHGLVMASVATALSYGSLLVAATIVEHKFCGRLHRKMFERVLSWEFASVAVITGFCLWTSAFAGPLLAVTLCVLMGLTALRVCYRGGIIRSPVRSRSARGPQHQSRS